MTGKYSQGSSLFWGLLRAQAAAAIGIAILVAIAGSTEQILIALWGGGISLIAYAWAGFQLWVHPKNRLARRQASAAIRAEVGKVVILLLLFWLTLSEWPATRSSNALILFAAFFVSQLAGWIWLARRLATNPIEAEPADSSAPAQAASDGNDDGNSSNKDT